MVITDGLKNAEAKDNTTVIKNTLLIVRASLKYKIAIKVIPIPRTISAITRICFTFDLSIIAPAITPRSTAGSVVISTNPSL